MPARRTGLAKALVGYVVAAAVIVLAGPFNLSLLVPLSGVADAGFEPPDP